VGHDEGLYRLLGSTHVAVLGSAADLRETGRTLRSVTVKTEPYTFDHAALCIDQGEQTEWSRVDNWEAETFVFLYPFLSPQWSVDGQPLSQATDEIHLNANSSFPLFDGNHPSGPNYRTESREVVVGYETFTEDGGLHGVRLHNRPEDGSFT
jgi:hypothetical protein